MLDLRIVFVTEEGSDPRGTTVERVVHSCLGGGSVDVGSNASMGDVVHSVVSILLRNTLSRRLSRRLNCSGCSCQGGRASGDEGKRSHGAVRADCKSVSITVPESHGNRCRPRLVGGCRGAMARSVRRGVLSVCTGKVAAKSVRSRVQRLCSVSVSSDAVDQVASGVLPVMGR